MICSYFCCVESRIKSNNQWSMIFLIILHNLQYRKRVLSILFRPAVLHQILQCILDWNLEKRGYNHHLKFISIFFSVRVMYYSFSISANEGFSIETIQPLSFWLTLWDKQSYWIGCFLFILNQFKFLSTNTVQFCISVWLRKFKKKSRSEFHLGRSTWLTTLFEQNI